MFSASSLPTSPVAMFVTHANTALAHSAHSLSHEAHICSVGKGKGPSSICLVFRPSWWLARRHASFTELHKEKSRVTEVRSPRWPWNLAVICSCNVHSMNRTALDQRAGVLQTRGIVTWQIRYRGESDSWKPTGCGTRFPWIRKLKVVNSWKPDRCYEINTCFRSNG
jgi:hypothetical protein